MMLTSVVARVVWFSTFRTTRLSRYCVAGLQDGSIFDDGCSDGTHLGTRCAVAVVGLSGILCGTVLTAGAFGVCRLIQQASHPATEALWCIGYLRYRVLHAVYGGQHLPFL